MGPRFRWNGFDAPINLMIQVMYRYSWGDSANLQKSPSINQLNMMDDCK
jgi:hypothetical protein